MNHDENDKLWELLGKAREPKVPPFFTGKVMRAIQEEEPVGLIAWLRAKWFIPATAAACAAVAAFVFLQVPPVNAPDTRVAAVDPLMEFAKAIPDDDLDTSLDSLLAAGDHSLWLSADPSSLY